MRPVILHYHYFKNAGTSVDAVLSQNFGDDWVTAEFEGMNNHEAVANWIRSHPGAQAFSSHTAQFPLPVVEGVLARQEGVLRASVAFGARRLFVEFDPAKTNRAALLEVAAKADIASYAEPTSPAAAASARPAAERTALRRAPRASRARAASVA